MLGFLEITSGIEYVVAEAEPRGAAGRAGEETPMRWTPLALFPFVATLGLAADPAPPVRPLADPYGGWCATSPATLDQLERVRTHTAADRTRRVRSDAVPAMRLQDGVHVMVADDATTPYDDPVDLAGTSLRFERVDDQSYRVSNVPLAYDFAVGNSIQLPARGGTTAQALPFAFPLYDQSLSTIHINELLAIRTQPIDSGEPGPRQYGPLELLTFRDAVIAPLLLRSTPPSSRFPVRTTFVKQTPEAVTITWRMAPATPDPADELPLDVDVQARLEPNGTIVFSYRKLQGLTWGGAVVSRGSGDWNDGRVLLARADDAANDAAGPDTWRALTDIRSVEFARVDGSDVLDIRIRFGAPFTPSTVPESGGVVSLMLTDGVGESVQLNTWIDRDDFYTCLPTWTCSDAEGFLRFDGDTLRLRVLEEQLALRDTALQFSVRTWNRVYSDQLQGTVLLGTASRRAESDLSSLDAPATLRGPIIESFTLPVLEPYAVYERLKAEHGLDDAEVDGVAIYQAFPTDIIFYAGAYSTMGNAGVDGIMRSNSTGSQVARRPALLHMNRVYVTRADDDRYSLRVLGHELGHRWLYHFTIDEDGQSTRSLNPASAHPAAYVHTPAAFRVFNDNESSTMGGGYFTQTGTSFRTEDVVYNTGYSWHDLYLMGLAAAGEVTPWYYIAGSSPELPREYYPPSRSTFSGTRVDVGVDQIVRSMGPRYPTSDFSQRNFRTLFVLLESPHTPATNAQIAKVGAFARNFETYFAKATGNRATTRNTLPVPPTASFTSSVSGAHVQFRDTSSDYPSGWLWSFGDGKSSTQQHPAHQYEKPGRYTVSVTVSNSRGSSTKTGVVEIAGSNRRRATRH